MEGMQNMSRGIADSGKTAQVSFSSSARQIIADQQAILVSAKAVSAEVDASGRRIDRSSQGMAASVANAAKRMVTDFGSARSASKDFSDRAAQTGKDVADASSVMGGSVSAMAETVKANYSESGRAAEDMAKRAQAGSALVADANGRMHDSLGRYVSKQQEAIQSNRDLQGSNAATAESNRGVIERLKERVTFTVGLSREQGSLRDKTAMLDEANRRLAASATEAGAGEDLEARATKDLAGAQERLNVARAGAMSSSTFVSNTRNETAALQAATTATNTATGSQVASMEILGNKAKQVEGSYAAMAAAARSSAQEQRRAMEDLSVAHSLQTKMILSENDKIIASNEAVAISRRAALEGVSTNEARNEMRTRDLVASSLPGVAGSVAQLSVKADDFARNAMNNSEVQDATNQVRAFQLRSTAEDKYYVDRMDHFRSIADETKRAEALENELADAIERRQRLEDIAKTGPVRADQFRETAPRKSYGTIGNFLVNRYTGGEGILTDDSAKKLRDLQRIAQEEQANFEEARSHENILQQIRGSGAIKTKANFDAEKAMMIANEKEAEKLLQDRIEAQDRASSAAYKSAARWSMAPLNSGIPGKWGLAAGPLLPAAVAGVGMLGAAALPVAAFGAAASAGLAAGAYSMHSGAAGGTEAGAMDKQIEAWSKKYGVSNTDSSSAYGDLLDTGIDPKIAAGIIRQSMQATGARRGKMADTIAAVQPIMAAYQPTSQKQASALMNQLFAGTDGDFAKLGPAISGIFPDAQKMGLSLPEVMAMFTRNRMGGRAPAQAGTEVSALLQGLQGGTTNAGQRAAAEALGLDPSKVFGNNIDAIGGISAVMQRIGGASNRDVGTVSQIMDRTGMSRTQATALQQQLSNPNSRMQALLGSSGAANEAYLLNKTTATGGTFANDIATIRQSTQGKGAIATAAEANDKNPMATFDKAKSAVLSMIKDVGQMFSPIIVQALKELNKLANWVSEHKSLFKPVVEEIKKMEGPLKDFQKWVTSASSVSALKRFWQEVQNVKDKVGGFFGAMGSEFGKLGPQFTRAIDDIKDGFSAFKGDAKGGEDTAKTFSDVIVGVIRFAAGVWDTEMHIIAYAVRGIETLAGWFKKLTDAVGLTSSKAKEGNASMVDLSGTAGKLVGIAVSLWGAFKVANAVWEGSRAILLTTRLALIGVKVETEAGTTVTKGAAIATKAWTAALWLGEQAGRAAAAAARLFGLSLIPAPIWIIIGVIAVLVGAFILAYTKIDWFRNMVNGAFDFVKKIAIELKDGVVGAIHGLVDGLSGPVKAIWDTLTGIFTKIYDFLLGHSVIPDIVNGIVKWFTNLPGMLGGALANLLSTILNALTGLAGSIGGWLKDRATQFMNGAHNIMTNFATGITNKAGQIKDALVGAVKAAIGAALDFIKGHNPFDWLGSHMPSFGSNGGGGWNGDPSSLAKSFGVQSQGFVNSGVEAGNVSMYKALGIPYKGQLLDWDYATKAGGQKVYLPGNKGTTYTFDGSKTIAGMGTADFFQTPNGGVVQTNHMQGAPGFAPGQKVSGGQYIGMSGEPTDPKYGTGWHLCIVTDANGRQFLAALSDSQMQGSIDSAKNLSSATRGYSSDINAAAKKFGISPAIIASVIQQESSGNRYDSTNHGRDIGLMQTSPAAARAGGGQWTFDPAQNIMAGTGYLKYLLNGPAKGDMRTALAMYNGGPGNPQYNYANTVLSRVSSGGFGGGGGTASTIGHGMGHEANYGPAPWEPPNPYNLGVGQFSAVNALARQSPNYPAYSTPAQAHAGWVQMGATDIPALQKSIASLAPEVRKGFEPAIAKVAETWRENGQHVNDQTRILYDQYRTKLASDQRDAAEKMHSFLQMHNINMDATQERTALRLSKIYDSNEIHEKQATENNRHILADYQIKKNQSDTSYLSRQAAIANEGGAKAHKAEMDVAQHFGISSKAAAAMLSESILHQGQNESIYAAKQKMTVQDLENGLHINAKRAQAILDVNIAKMEYQNSKKTTDDWNTYQKHLKGLGAWAVQHANLLHDQLIALRAQIAKASTPEARYTAEQAHQAHIIKTNTLAGESLLYYGQQKDAKGRTVESTVAAVAAAMNTQSAMDDAAANFADRVAARRHDIAGVQSGLQRQAAAATNRGVGALYYGDTTTTTIDGRKGAETIKHTDALGSAVDTVAAKLTKLNAIADDTAKFNLMVAEKMGDFPNILSGLQAQIAKVSNDDLAKLGVAIIQQTGNYVALTQAVIADENAAKRRQTTEDVARTTADATNGSFNALSSDLGKMGSVINDQVLTDLMKGHGLNQSYMDGMNQLRNVQLTMTQTTEGVNAVLSAQAGDLAGMNTAVTNLSNVSLARWSQALHNGEGVQNQYSAELVKEVNTLRLIQTAQLANDYAIGQMTQDVGRVNSALQGFFTMAIGPMDLWITNMGRVDDLIPKAGDSLGTLSDNAIKTALNLGNLDDIISALNGVVDKNRQAAEKEYATTGRISPSTMASYSAASATAKGAAWDQVGADLQLAKGTKQITSYYQTLGNEINLETDRVANLAITQGTSSQAYKDQVAILGNMKQQYAGLGFAIDQATNGTILTADQQKLATWAVEQFTTDGISPAEAALNGMTIKINQSGIDVATANEKAAAATADLGTNAANAAGALGSMIGPITALVSAINGMNQVRGGPVTVTGSPVTVTGSVSGGAPTQFAGALNMAMAGAPGNQGAGNPFAGAMNAANATRPGATSTVNPYGTPNAQGLYPNQIVKDPNAGATVYALGNNPGYNPGGSNPYSLVTTPKSNPVGSIATTTTSPPGGGGYSPAPISYVPPNNTTAGGGLSTNPYSGASGGGGDTGGGGSAGAPSSGVSSTPTSGGSTGTMVPVPAGDPRGPNAVLAQANAIVSFTSLMTKNAGPAQLKAAAEQLQASTNIDAATKVMMQVGVEGGKNQKQMLDAAKVSIQAEMDVIQANYENAQAGMSAATTMAGAATTFQSSVNAFGQTVGGLTQGVYTGSGSGSVPSLATGGGANDAGANSLLTALYGNGPNSPLALYGRVVGTKFGTGGSQDPLTYDVSRITLPDGINATEYEKDYRDYLLHGAGGGPAQPYDAYQNALAAQYASIAWSDRAAGPAGASFDPFAAGRAIASGTPGVVIGQRDNGNGYIVNYDINGNPVIPGLSTEQAYQQTQAGLAANYSSYMSMMTGVGTTYTANGAYLNGQDPGTGPGGLVAQQWASWLANGGGSNMTNMNGGGLVPTGVGSFSIIPDGAHAVPNGDGTYTVMGADGSAISPSSMTGYNWLGGVVGSLSSTLNNAQLYPAIGTDVGNRSLISSGGSSGQYSTIGTTIGNTYAIPSSSYGTSFSSGSGWGGGYGLPAPLATLRANVQQSLAGFDTGFGTNAATGSGTTTNASGYQNDPVYIKLKAMLDALNAIESNTADTADNTAALADIKSWMKELSDLEQTSATRQILGPMDWESWFSNIGIAGVGMLAGGAT